MFNVHRVCLLHVYFDWLLLEFRPKILHFVLHRVYVWRTVLGLHCVRVHGVLERIQLEHSVRWAGDE